MNRTVLEWLAALAPEPIVPAPGPEFERAVAVSGLERDPETLLGAAVGTTTLAAALGAGVLLANVRGGGLLAGALLTTGSGVGYALSAVPGWLATARRTRAVGDVPELVGLAVLRSRVAPTPEGAAAFAGEHARDPLAASLREHVRRARGTPQTGWEGFVDTWGQWDPSLRRAVSLLGAALHADPGDRERLLDRSLSVVLAGTRDRMAAFAARIRGPTSALYAFGVVLPLALVATIPAVRGAGVPVSVPAVVAVYDLLLPVVLLGAAAWLLARRPVAFPPAPVGRDHPDVPDRRGTALAVAVGGALLAAAVAGHVAPPWTRWVAAPGVGTGAGLVWWFDPVRRVRERVETVEDGLADALAFVGQRLQRGESPERAVAAAGRELSGPVAEVFADAARIQTLLRLDVSASFLGARGALADLPSPRAHASAALLDLAATEGPDGGQVLVEMAEYVDDLVAVERDARQNLATVTGTLRSTAFCFAPLIGGATVALSDRLQTVQLPGGQPPFPTAALGLAVGAYVVVLAAILAGLAASLDRGLDRARIGFHAGAAVLAASALYPLAVAGAGLLV